MELAVSQQFFLLITSVYALIAAVLGFHHTHHKKNSNGLTPFFYPLGAFVWADAMVFGVFWILITVVSWLRQDWLLFLLSISLFWLVRSIGETIYWFNQQFASVPRDKPESLVGYRFVHSDAIWFVYQIMHQCITVITILTSLYLGHAWLATL